MKSGETKMTGKMTKNTRMYTENGKVYSWVSIRRKVYTRDYVLVALTQPVLKRAGGLTDLPERVLFGVSSVEVDDAAGLRRSTVIVCALFPICTLNVFLPGSMTLKGPW